MYRNIHYLLICFFLFSAKDFSGDVAKTLESGIRVILYVGDMDWICNW